METTDNYWTEKFSNFLYENHPDLLYKLKEDGSLDDFILQRSEAAKNDFDLLREQGINLDCCIESATAVMYEGLKFSRFNMVEDILEEQFTQKYDEFEDEYKRKAYLVQLVLKCEGVFEKYDCSDDYAYDGFFEADIIGTIEEILEENAVSN